MKGAVKKHQQLLFYLTVSLEATLMKTKLIFFFENVPFLTVREFQKSLQ
jgi:hypothetical protein